MSANIVEDEEAIKEIRTYAERNGIKIASLIIGLDVPRMKYVFHCEADYPTKESYNGYMKFVAEYLGCRETDLRNRSSRISYIS